jgi:ferredoxin
MYDMAIDKSKPLNEQLKSLAKAIGADLVGIAPIERFEGAPDFSHPQNLIPDAKSVIVIAKRMLRTPQKIFMERKSRYPNQRFNGRFLWDFLDETTYYLGYYLEDLGYSACPVAANLYYDFHKGHPQLSHKHSAMAAGLGRIGWSSLLITPQYGAAVQLASVITNAELEPDPMIEKDICNKCYKCMEVCPTGMRDPEETQSFAMEGKSYYHAKYRKLRCLWGCGGLTGQGKTWSMSDLPMPVLEDENDMEQVIWEFANAKSRMHPVEQFLTAVQGLSFCGQCHIVCHPEDLKSKD